MNNIKINDEIYGTSMASEVTYDGGGLWVRGD